MTDPTTPAARPLPADVAGLVDYNAGLLNDWGGGNVEWWWDYMRAEIGRANDHWREQATDTLEAQARQIADLTAEWATVKAERDRQYDENVHRIAEQAKADARAEKAEAAHRELSLDQIAAMDRIAELAAENARLKAYYHASEAFISVEAKLYRARAAMKVGDNG